MNKKKTLVIVAVAAIAALAVWLLSGGKKEEKITFDTAAVAPANIMNSITATGTIEPVTSVTVGTQVSGIVSKLFVDYNSVVKKGQVIAELDKTNLMSQLNTAKTQLATAQSQLNYQTANYKRYKTLFEKGLVAAADSAPAPPPPPTPRNSRTRRRRSRGCQQRRRCNAHRPILAMPLSPRPSTAWCYRSRLRRDRPLRRVSLRRSCSP